MPHQGSVLNGTAKVTNPLPVFELVVEVVGMPIISHRSLKALTVNAVNFSILLRNIFARN